MNIIINYLRCSYDYKLAILCSYTYSYIMYAFMLHNVTNPLIICMYMYRTRIQRLAAVLAALGRCTYQDGTGNQLIQSKI